MPKRNALIRGLAFLAGTSASTRDLCSPVAAIRLVAVATIVYGVLMSSWLNVYAHFSPIFRGYGNWLFADGFWSHDEASVHFFDAAAENVFEQVDKVFFADLPPGTFIPPAQGEKDTLLFLQNEHPPGAGFLRTGGRLMAFTPTVILVALVVATPVGLRRRLWLAAGSFALLAGFIAFRLSILVTQGTFAHPDKTWRLYNPSEFWRDVLWRTDNIVCDNPDFHYVAPVLIWASVAVVVSMIAHALRSRRKRRGAI